MKPGESINLSVTGFDAQGHPATSTAAMWTLEGLKGALENGRFTPDSSAGADQSALPK